MCAANYIDILRNEMLPFAEDRMSLKWEFMQDNVPKHSARSVKLGFQQNEVSVIRWPPQLQDLNPIEHLWGGLKHKIGNFK